MLEGFCLNESRCTAAELITEKAEWFELELESAESASLKMSESGKRYEGRLAEPNESFHFEMPYSFRGLHLRDWLGIYISREPQPHLLDVDPAKHIVFNFTRFYDAPSEMLQGWGICQRR